VPFSVRKTDLTAGLCEHGGFLPLISAGKPPFFRQIDAFRGYSVLYNMLVINQFRIKLAAEWERAPDKGICQLLADV